MYAIGFKSAGPYPVRDPDLVRVTCEGRLLGTVKLQYQPQERWTTVYFSKIAKKSDTFAFTLINEKRSELELGEIVFIGLVDREFEKAQTSAGKVVNRIDEEVYREMPTVTCVDSSIVQPNDEPVMEQAEEAVVDPE